MSIMMVGFSLDVKIWGGWSFQQRMLQLCIATWWIWPGVGLGNLEVVTPVGPLRRIVLVMLTFGWRLPVFTWWNMVAWSWVHRWIIQIWMASRWIASWILSLTGIRYWSCLRVSVPACDDILLILFGGVILPGVLDQIQWRVWDPEVSTESCPQSWWGSPH